jgi:PEGA domain
LTIFRAGLSVGATFVLGVTVTWAQARSTTTPDLSGLNQAERQSIEAACSGAKYVQGPAAYNRCLRDQLAALSQWPAKSTEAPVNASVVITSTPTQADIEIDGKYAGSTKSSTTLSPGTHAVIIKRNGYEPWSRTIEVAEGSELTINADLQPTKNEPAQNTTPSKN